MNEDHARLDRLLEASLKADGTIDASTYARFRHDLLQHIAREEKVLLPYARAKRGGQPLTIAQRLRADHGRIAKLLVSSPTVQSIAELTELLREHNPLEEGASGMYAECDMLAGDEASALVDQLRAQPRVPVAPYYDGPPHRRDD